MPFTLNRGKCRVSGGGQVVANIPIAKTGTATVSAGGSLVASGIKEILFHGEVSFYPLAYSVNENESIQIPVTRQNGQDGAITVDWALTGTSTSDQSGTLVWGDQDPFDKQINITAGPVSSTETGEITLSNPTGGAVLAAPLSVGLDILDTTSDTPDYPDPIAGVTVLPGRNTVNVTSDAELATALANATAGDTIQLAAGTYSDQHTLNKSAPANNPIIVRGANDFASICSDKWTVDGDRNIVTGILFSGADVNLNLYGNNCKVIGNKFTGWGSLTIGSRYAITARYSTFAEIAYNEFYEHGPFIQNSYLNDPVYGGDGTAGTSLRMGIRTSEGSSGANMPTDSWVHHNLFRDFPDKPRPENYSSGQNDALEWGETERPFTPNFSTRLYFESNMILRCLSGLGGPGVGFVDLKTGGGSVCRYNTWKDSANKLAQRGSTVEGVTFESNYFVGSLNNESITMHGCNNKVIGNVCDGAIKLAAGQTACGVNAGTAHATCNANTVAGNQSQSLIIGRNHGAAPYVPVTNTLIEQHTGSISLENENSTVNNAGQNTSINFVAAVPLTESQVGPAGLALALQSYKDARGLSESETPDYADPLAGVTLLGGRRIVNVATDGELTTALNNAQAGDTIRLANGTYSTTRDIDQTFPADNPLIIEAVNGSPTWGAVATARWDMTGNYNILKGIKFDGAPVRLWGTNNKLLACGFTGTRSYCIQLGNEPSRWGEVAYCEFWELNEDNNGDLFRQAIKMNTSSDLSTSVHDDVWIHHCYFHDIDTAQYGQGDLIEWGESGLYALALSRRIGLYFEDNLIERFFRSANLTIDAKIGGYVIRRNTQRLGSDTDFATRFGGNGIIESNYMNPGGIKCYGRDNVIVGNVCTGSLYPQAGQVAIDTLPTNLHHPAYDNLIAGNTASMTVGRVPTASDPYDVPASGTIIEDHTGSINLTSGLHIGTIDNRNDPSSRNFAPAVELQVSEVGPAAITNAAEAYKNARDI